MTPNLGAAEERLQELIGYRFRGGALLDRALTHSSAFDGKEPPGEGTYERLEFLGDRVLSLVIAELLFAAFPKASEGELHRRHASLVRKEICAEVATAIGLGAAIRLGGGEAQSGGRSKAAILGDVCEALIGALYLDGGLAPARAFIESHWRDRMFQGRAPLRDAKTTLQEWAQGRGLSAPIYAIAERSGPHHAPRFVVTVSTEATAPAQGEGRSKREAEQNAAAALLVREGVWRAEG